MCVGHSRRNIIWRDIVYSCAKYKLISSRRSFLLFMFLVLGRSHIIALRRSHNDGHREKTWRERPSNMISKRDISKHDPQRQEVSRSNVPLKMRPCEIKNIVQMIMDTMSQDRL
jgi:hypothetical protein